MCRLIFSLKIVLCCVCVGAGLFKEIVKDDALLSKILNSAAAVESSGDAVRAIISEDKWGQLQEEGVVDMLMRNERDASGSISESKESGETTSTTTSKPDDDEDETEDNSKEANISKRESETLYLNIVNISLPNLLADLGKRDVHEVEAKEEKHEQNEIINRQLRESETLYLNIVNISLPNLLADLGKRDTTSLKDANRQHKEKRQATTPSSSNGSTTKASCEKSNN